LNVRTLICAFLPLTLIIFTNQILSAQNHWTMVLESDKRLYDVQFINKDTGFVISQTTYGGYIKADLFATEDGGNNWIPIYHIYYTTGSGFYQSLNSVFFINRDTGMMFGNTSFHGRDYWTKGFFLRTTDGGISWSEANEDAGNANNLYSDCYLYNKDTIYFEEGLKRSTDAGLTWQKTKYNFNGSIGFDHGKASLKSSLFGLVISDDSTISKTEDGGDTWGTIVPRDINGNRLVDLKIIRYINEQWVGIAYPDVDSIGRFLISSDDGNTWDEVGTMGYPRQYSDRGRSAGLEHISFASGGSGFFVQPRYQNPGSSDLDTSAVFRTTDAGRSWKKISVNGSSNVGKIYSVSDKIAYAIIDDSILVKTIDGGGISIVSTPPTPGIFKLKENPVLNDATFIFEPFPSSRTLEIMDILGNTVHSRTVAPNTSTLTIDVHSLIPNVYFCRIGQQSEKFVKLY
jgi:photosystem II stability/assembly factor-like uncharacterized protein